MTPLQLHALSQFLTDFPNDLEYQEILHLISSNEMDDDDFTVWQPFENASGEYLAEQIENAYDSAATLLKLYGVDLAAIPVADHEKEAA